MLRSGIVFHRDDLILAVMAGVFYRRSRADAVLASGDRGWKTDVRLRESGTRCAVVLTKSDTVSACVSDASQVLLSASVDGPEQERFSHRDACR